MSTTRTGDGVQERPTRPARPRGGSHLLVQAFGNAPVAEVLRGQLEQVNGGRFFFVGNLARDVLTCGLAGGVEALAEDADVPVTKDSSARNEAVFDLALEGVTCPQARHVALLRGGEVPKELHRSVRCSFELALSAGEVLDNPHAHLVQLLQVVAGLVLLVAEAILVHHHQHAEGRFGRERFLMCGSPHRLYRPMQKTARALVACFDRAGRCPGNGRPARLPSITDRYSSVNANSDGDDPDVWVQ